jgi:hypothetical protein
MILLVPAPDPVSEEDFEAALATTKPSSVLNLDKYEKWFEKLGSL